MENRATHYVEMLKNFCYALLVIVLMAVTFKVFEEPEYPGQPEATEFYRQ
jgi:hypothetical protein